METKFSNMIDAIKEVAAKSLPDGSQMSIFGSRARGDYSPESDWDIHILIPGEERLSIDRIQEIAAPIEKIGWDFDQYISAMVYSYLGWKKRSFLPFYKNVETDKVIIFQN